MRSQTKTYYPVSAFVLIALTYLINTTELLSQSHAPVVASFTLMNADTDTDIGFLNDGDTIVLSNLPTSKLNIRANTSPATVDQVSFDFNSTKDYSIENNAPYALFGDRRGDYQEWTPSAGSYNLTASARLNGTTGPNYTLNFYVTNGSITDCNGDINGSARIDDCGICAGGNTGLIPNANKDACGVCFGNGSSCAGTSPGGSTGGLVCGNYPGGRIAMASDGNNADADDHGGTAFSIAMLHYAGLLDKLVFIGHSSLYKSSCNNAYGNWCDLMDSASTGAMLRFGGDTSIIYSFKDDYDDNNQLDESIAAFTAAINASSPGDPLWIYCAGPMDVVYRAIDNATPSKRAFVKCISHSGWNENSTYGGLSYVWADLKKDFTNDGVQFYEIKDQNKSNGNLDFAQESNGTSNWDWLTQSGNPTWTWVRNTNLDIWLQTNKNKAFDISDAGMMYWLISGGPQGGCDTCGPIQVEQLFKNPCIVNPGNNCTTNKAGTGSMLSPNDNAVFSENTTIAVAASINDPDQNTELVQFFVGTNLKATMPAGTGSYSYQLKDLDTGYHQLYARAIDSCGATGYTDTIRIYVEGVDCAGVAGGNAFIDNCGSCAGGTTGVTANNSCIDCAGVANGTAFLDSCGVCAGGNTGITPGASCSPFTANQVQSLTLMSAGNGGAIRQLVDGDIINTSIVGSFSVRADICNNGIVGSVVFQLDGTSIRNENIAPYAINGDNSGGYKAWNPGDGTYLLSAIPYSNRSGGGAMGIPLTLSITITSSGASMDCNGVTGGTASIDQCGICSGGNTGIAPNSTCLDCNGDPNGSAAIDNCGVCSGGNTGITPNSNCNTSACAGNEIDALMLVDASNSNDLRPLVSGDTIDLNFLPLFSVRADACDQSQVESVSFKLNGSVINTENVEPYAVNGDSSGIYNPWPLSVGSHVLEVTPYSSNRGGGVAGPTDMIQFYVVNSTSNSSRSSGRPDGSTDGTGNGLEKAKEINATLSKSLIHKEVVAFTVEAYPNPTNGEIRLEFTSGVRDAHCEVYNSSGKQILSLKEIRNSDAIDLSPYSRGLYWIKVYAERQVDVIQVIKQ
jgi:hypothetical protein